jgi:hypothetical protein
MLFSKNNIEAFLICQLSVLERTIIVAILKLNILLRDPKVECDYQRVTKRGAKVDITQIFRSTIIKNFKTQKTLLLADGLKKTKSITIARNFRRAIEVINKSDTVIKRPIFNFISKPTLISQ